MSAALSVSRAAAPDVSVLLVVHNAWDWTARAIEALADTTPGGYELIAVDNGSTDGAAAGLDAVAGATVLHNRSNVGFGPAANQAAAMARGRHLFLLNSDALLQPGWLEPLLDVADGDASVGAVASRLLNLDGTLQEAGALVWSDGTVLNYGDGEPPEQPEHLFVRDVDYASAAALLVRRDVFWRAGGFDPVYAPAYMEDVDLCFRIRQLGWRVVYQPFSTAVHVRWASGDRSATIALLDRNRPIFQARWKDVLVRRPSYPGTPDGRMLIAARDTECLDRVLVIVDAIPDDPEAPQRVLAEARTAVGLDHPIRLTVAARHAATDQATAPLRRAGIEVVAGVRSWPAWLEARRLHYTVVLLTGSSAPDLDAALSAHQSAARRL